MNINNLFSSLQPAVAKIQEQMQPFFKIQEQMQAFDNTFYKLPRQMLEFEKKMLSFSSLYDNEALIKLRQVKKELNIINERNATITMFMAQYKDLQNITQTFYGLQFSTTIKKNNQTETQTTQTFYHETTISQAEHTRILSERDYLISTQQTIILELRKENENLKYQISYISKQPTHKQVASKGGKNSYQKYKPLKAKVEELCKITLQKNKNISALKLCNVVGNMIEKEHSEFLTNFKPYQDYLNANGTDWLKPTFYNWCLSVHKNTTQAK